MGRRAGGGGQCAGGDRGRSRDGDAGAVELRSFDQTLEPLRFALEHAEELGYPAGWKREIGELLATGRAEAGRVAWRLELGDFRERVGHCAGPAGAVLFDPDSPAANPGMWTQEVFRALRERAVADCTLTTYSRSTVTRARLLLAGWCVGRRRHGREDGDHGSGDADRGAAEPLGRDWLERVRRSAAPGLRERRDDCRERRARTCGIRADGKRAARWPHGEHRVSIGSPIAPILPSPLILQRRCPRPAPEPRFP